jgi:signal transduction histidine kinase
MGVLETLLSNRNLADASRASLIIFDDPQGDGPPTYTEPVAVWQRDPDQTGAQVSLDKRELLKLCRRDSPLVIEDSHDDPRVDGGSRQSFESIGTRSLVIYPLVAGGLWYGVIAFHWTEPHQIADDEARHIMGLVDQAAAAIYSFRLLVAEAQARQAAEHANQIKIKFLAMISHELRTPLTSIQGYADTLLAEDVAWDADTQRMFIQIINDESDNLRELIEQLLDLSRLEAGMLTIHREPHPLGAILADARPHLDLRAADHKLVYDIPDDLPFVDVDPQRIQQVIQNLVHNAAKYAPAGTTIRIAAEAHDDVVRVDVDDEGPGIPPEERDMVFEAFQQAAGEVDAAQGGAGLGLAICRGIVSAHGGKIWISDEVEKGLRISFTLPIAVPEEDE